MILFSSFPFSSLSAILPYTLFCAYLKKINMGELVVEAMYTTTNIKFAFEADISFVFVQVNWPFDWC